MRLLVAAAAAALFAQCTGSLPEDLPTPTARTAPATANAAGTARTATSPAPDPVSAPDAAKPAAPGVPDPMSAAEAANTAAPAIPGPTGAVAPAGPRCIQPTSAIAPPPVAPVPASLCPPDPGGDQHVPIGQVVFPDAGGASVEAELVSSPQDTQRGLMYRTSMPEDHGMLFDMMVRGNYQLWMHDTCIPLDMVFADVDGLIVGIVENARPLDDTPRGVSCPWRYVLEVNAGWTRAHGVKAGQHMTTP